MDLRVAQMVLRVSHEVEVKLSAEAAVIWRFDGDQIICFEDGLLTWLLAVGLSSEFLLAVFLRGTSGS